jgi:hypothetical protein
MRLGQLATGNCTGRSILQLAAVVVFLAYPDRLTGDSEHAVAMRQRQVTKIDAWLGQGGGIEGGLTAELASRIVEESERNALDPVLLLAIIQVESRFNHKAVSPRGAQGLMQIKPVVVSALIDEGRLHPRQRHRSLKDPLVNVQIGASYLAFLHEMFGDLKVALTAYNWGPTRVRHRLRTNQELPLDYATKVLSVQSTLEQTLALNTPYFRELDSADVASAG